MALVTVHAVIDVTADALMLGIRVRLGVAVRALKDAVVSGIGVTSGANAICVAVIGIEPGMVESCTCPTGCRMAERTRGRETSGNVVRTIRRLVFRLVATIAVGGKRGVIVIYVAIRTQNFGVETCQRERSVVVIESGR